MILISYVANGETGGCRRGCCGPDRVWGSELKFNVVADYGEALEKAVALATYGDVSHSADWEHHLLRPALGTENGLLDYDTIGGPPVLNVEGQFLSGLVSYEVHNSDAYHKGVKAVFAARAMAALLEKEQQAALALKKNEDWERAQLQALKEKYEK